MDYDEKKRHYMKENVVASYEDRRFSGRSGHYRNGLKMAAIAKALAKIESPGLMLDLPAGTGRFYSFLAEKGLRFVGADVSHSMLVHSRSHLVSGSSPGLAVTDAEALPFRDDAFDIVMSIRFLFHLPAEVRIKILREMARISKRYLILDYRFRFALRNLSRLAMSMVGLAKPFRGKVSKNQMLAELEAAGLAPLCVIRVLPVFSDKHIVLCRKA